MLADDGNNFGGGSATITSYWDRRDLFRLLSCLGFESKSRESHVRSKIHHRKEFKTPGKRI